ncbi:MAG: hypothetical protein H7Y18_00025 [Clostridiaceae bacterium]|nr:hypothetical protein [Clostridiaceae bacterium]
MEEMLLLISQSEKIRRKTHKLSHNYNLSHKYLIQYIDNFLYFILYFVQIYLTKLEKNEEESLNSTLASIGIYIESTEKKVYWLSRHHKRTRKSLRKLIKNYESLITIYLSHYLINEDQDTKVLLAKSITELSAYTTELYNNINYRETSEPKDKIIEKQQFHEECTLGTVTENQVAVSSPYRNRLQENSSEIPFLHEKDDISNNIPNIIKTKFTGTKISVPISDTENIKGEIIFNIKGIVSLKSKNRIFFINEKTIPFFY